MDLKKFCKDLPKLELHAHLNGSISPVTLKKLGCLSDNVIEYQKLTKLFNASEKSLEECFAVFKIAHSATVDKKSVYLATKSIIEDFHNDNVIYLELRTTPRETSTMSKMEYVESVVKAILDSSNKYSIITKLLLSIDRAHDLQTCEDSMNLIIKMKNKYPHVIKGVDLSGNPIVGSFSPSLFKEAVNFGLFVTLHCAEVRNIDEIKEILEFKPNRIGHATCLHPKYGGSEEIWKLYCQLKIPLECCLTSNIACGTSKNYKEHHLQEWINNSLPFTLCTDDKGVFDTTVSQEMLIAGEQLNLAPRDLWELSFNAVDYTFASNTEKTILKEILVNWKLKNQF